MGVTFMSGQHREKEGAENVFLRGRIRTGIEQRALAHPRLPKTIGLEEVDEITHRSKGGHSRFCIPANEDFPVECIHRRAYFRLARQAFFQLTSRVSRYGTEKVTHASRYQYFSCPILGQNAGFRVKDLRDATPQQDVGCPQQARAESKSNASRIHVA